VSWLPCKPHMERYVCYHVGLRDHTLLVTICCMPLTQCAHCRQNAVRNSCRSTHNSTNTSLRTFHKIVEMPQQQQQHRRRRHHHRRPSKARNATLIVATRSMNWVRVNEPGLGLGSNHSSSVHSFHSLARYSHNNLIIIIIWRSDGEPHTYLDHQHIVRNR
jgi:hypothetical protein